MPLKNRTLFLLLFAALAVSGAGCGSASIKTGGTGGVVGTGGAGGAPASPPCVLDSTPIDKCTLQ
jgi:hypothetical protein